MGEDGTYGDTEVSLSDNARIYITGDNVAEYDQEMTQLQNTGQLTAPRG